MGDTRAYLLDAEELMAELHLCCASLLTRANGKRQLVTDRYFELIQEYENRLRLGLI